MKEAEIGLVRENVAAPIRRMSTLMLEEGLSQRDAFLRTKAEILMGQASNWERGDIIAMFSKFVRGAVRIDLNKSGGSLYRDLGF